MVVQVVECPPPHYTQALLLQFMGVEVVLEVVVAVAVQILILLALPYKPELYQQMQHKEAASVYPHPCKDDSPFQRRLQPRLGLAVLGLAVERREDIEY